MFEAKINEYKKEYEKYVKSKDDLKYKTKASNKQGDIYNSEIASLLFYESHANAENLFLITPSIFNSPEILFLSKNNNFIDNLLQYGDIYLIDWKQSNKQLLIKDLVEELENIIQFLKRLGKKINLIGHCIGGNICIGASDNSDICSLTLLTTPWDFSHLQKFAMMRNNLDLMHAVKDTEMIPKLYMQIIFFLMFPLQFNNKVEKYFALPPESRELFLIIEHWLQSGINIPKSLFEDIVTNFCIDNVCFNKKWQIGTRLVDTEKLTMPTCIIYADGDQIVPYNSILSLPKAIKNSILIKVKGGHISYLINSKTDFIDKYNEWLNKIF